MLNNTSWCNYYEINPLFEQELPIEPETDIDDPAYRLDRREYLGKMAVSLQSAVHYLIRKRIKCLSIWQRMLDDFDYSKYHRIMRKYGDYMDVLKEEIEKVEYAVEEYRKIWLDLHWKIESNKIDDNAIQKDYEIWGQYCV